MRVLLITQWFNPEPNNMKALIFAKELQKRGNEVEVLTGFPNYPTGTVYEGYKLRRYQCEEMEGIPVHRVWLYPSHDGNKWRRLANYFSFALSARFTGKRKIKGKFDVVYVYHPPISSTIPAISIAKKKKAKLVLDVNDLWPDSVSATGMLNNPKLLNYIAKWCDCTYKKADAVCVLSQGIRNLLIERGVPENKIRVIPVWCNEEILTEKKNEAFIAEHQLENRFVVMYGGAIGAAQGLEVLVDVAQRLQRENIRICIIGTGTKAEAIAEAIREKALDNIAVLPPVPSDQIAGVLNCADALFVHLKPNPLFDITIPSKIPMNMALKKPLVAGLSGDAADIIVQSEGGILCKPGDAGELTNAIMTLKQMSAQERRAMAEKGYAYYKAHLSMESGINAFYKLFEELA